MGNTLKVGDIVKNEALETEFLVLEIANINGYLFYRVLTITGTLDGLRSWVSQYFEFKKIGNIFEKSYKMDKQNAKNEKAMVDMYNQEMKELQDNQKQIDEMARTLTTCERNSCVGCGRACIDYRMANALYNAGYRKIPENAVVLTREEHQKYLAFKIIEPQVRGCLDRERELQKQVKILTEENKELYKEHTTLIAGSILKQQDIVKDTAREILQELYDQIDENTPKWVGVQIKIIAKRKGVEVK